MLFRGFLSLDNLFCVRVFLVFHFIGRLAMPWFLEDKQIVSRFYVVVFCPRRQDVKGHPMHIGRRIQEVVSAKGLTVVAFSRQLCCTRANAYKIFSRPSIDTHSLARICRILDHDFFADLSQDMQSDSM